jgi:hypothetical protein
MILVDSSVWVAYFNGETNPHTDYLDQILGVEPIGIGDLILTEVLQGFRSEHGYKTAKSLLLDLTVFQMLGRDRAIRTADNYRFLRKKGITVRKTVDAVIATFCIDEGFPLLFRDRDFEPFARYLNLKLALPVGA